MDGIDAFHVHAQATADRHDFRADLADADDQQVLSENLAARQSVAIEGFELTCLHRQFPRQRHPQQQRLLRHRAVAVQRQIAARQLRMAARQTVAAQVVVACAARQNTLQFRRPFDGNGGLRAHRNDRRGRLRHARLLTKASKKYMFIIMGGLRSCAADVGGSRSCGNG